jgi:NAD(P) transhydrogenase subunit alpha
VVIVGAITITGEEGATPLAKTLGFVAVFCATVNLVSGFMITDRMLKMFKPRGK